MKRIVYAWNYVEWGGAQIHFLALIKEARKHFDVEVVLPSGSDTQFLGFLDAERVAYRQFEGSVDLGSKKGIAAKIGRHVTRIKSEFAMLKAIRSIGEVAIVHTDLFPGQSLFSLVWLAFRYQVFITLHNAQPAVGKLRWAIWKIKFALISRAETFHVFCTNEHAAGYYRRLFTGRTAEEIRITYDSIDLVEIAKALREPFDREATFISLGLPATKFVILTVGQFIDRKGRWTLLKAAQEVLKKTSDVLFVWVTPALPDPNDQKRIEEYGLDECLELVKSDSVGNERRDILRFFRSADIFVLPSFVEGVPIALLEAMAIGLPVISTKVFGIPEAVIHETTGLLVEAGDASALSAAILRLLNDREHAQDLAFNGKKYAEEKFDERVAARVAADAYLSAIAASE